MSSKRSQIVRFRVAFHSDNTDQGYVIQIRVGRRFPLFEKWTMLEVNNGFEKIWRYKTALDAEEALVNAVRKMILIESEYEKI